MMIDMEKLHDKITEFIVSHRYFEMHPIGFFSMTYQDIIDCQNEARKLYQNDQYFHAIVQGIVSGILDVVKGCTTSDRQKTCTKER